MAGCYFLLENYGYHRKETSLLNMWMFGIVVLVCSLTAYSEERCPPGTYGEDCALNCSQNCYILPNASLTCNKETGKCSEGCKAGVYLDLCNEPCSKNCKDSICNQHNGHCTHGCIEEHLKGDFCETIQGSTNDGYTTITTSIEPTHKSASEPVAINRIIAVVVVIVLLLAGSVCAAIILRRCMTKGQHDLEAELEPLQDRNQNANPGEDTILHIACRNGTLSKVSHILSQDPVAMNSKGRSGWTPVMIAAKHGRRDLVEFLMNKGCDLSVPDNEGNTILHVASVEGNMKIVRYVLSKKVVDVNSLGHWNRTPVMAAARYGHTKVFKLLTKKGSNMTSVDDDGNNILHIACIGGNVKIVKFILTTSNIDINSRGNNDMTPVMFAVNFGHIQVFDLLAGNKCILPILEGNGRNILHLACVEGNVDMVEHILGKKIVPINNEDKTGRTPLMLATEGGHTNVFKVLMDNKCDLNGENEEGNNILHMSCALGRADIVKTILKDSRIDVNSRGHNEMTPLMFAVKNGHFLIATLLFSKECQVSLKDGVGNTVLHMACTGGNPDIVEYVLSNHIWDVNSRGQFGRTPLMMASAGGHEKVFDLLVNRGADLYLFDDDGFNILHLTCMGGHSHMLEHVQNIMGRSDV